MTIPTRTPASLVAGDSLQWTVHATHNGAHLDPADGWSLTYTLVQAKASQTVPTTDNGDGTFLASLTAVQTADWAPGSYAYQARAVNGPDSHTVETGTIEVAPNFASGHAFDTRSWEERSLEKHIEAYDSTADTRQISVSIEGRTFTYESKAELQEAIRELERRVRSRQIAELIKKGGANPNQILTRF